MEATVLSMKIEFSNDDVNFIIRNAEGINFCHEEFLEDTLFNHISKDYDDKIVILDDCEQTGNSVILYVSFELKQ
jgi:hypothetical protein